MRSFSILFLCGASALCFCPEPRLRADTRPADGEREMSEMVAAASTEMLAGEMVVRATYGHGIGVCVPIGGGHARMTTDEFVVVEVLKGQFKARRILVRPMSGPSYSNDLTVGATYVVRLKPSKQTAELLRERAKEGLSFLCVSGTEITVKKEDK